MAMSVLYWSNVDTYTTLTSIKIQSVIEKMEEQMPFQCHLAEKAEIDRLRKEKKIFLFSDVQKLLALIVFLPFMVVFCSYAVPAVIEIIPF